MKPFSKIGILAGGPSSEREISLKSGEAVYDVLRNNGHDAVFIDVLSSADIDKTVRKAGADVFFIVLHGGFGENGTIQTILRDLKMPYTGSGPDASRLALDKLASRRIFQENGLAVPEYRIFTSGFHTSDCDLKVPLVVKPQCEGSSIGLSVVCDIGQMNSALDRAFSYGDNVLIDKFISGRELTVGILDEKPLPVIEIVTEKGCYDYNAKYESHATEYLVPSPISEKDSLKAQEIGLKAHNLLGCRSFSRVDMILGEDGNIYVLEVNTIPGLTSRSLLPKAASAAGIDFYSLCIKILEGAKT